MNSTPKNLIYLFIAALMMSSQSACEQTPPEVEPTPTNPGPTQYGTPFDQVPATGDIAMYEVNPKVFSAAGNLDGITARLDSIKALGINMVWLMPIYQTGSERSVGSPYAIRDYKSIHSDYGTLTDLRELVDKAHGLGMAVMLDWVANHTAWDHAWMNKAGWYTTDASGNVIIPPGTNWQDVAELNFNNQDMRQEMIAAMKYWVLEANVDGFRCDYAEGVPADFWKMAIDTLRAIPNREIRMFAEAGDKNLLEAGFDMYFGWAFYGKLKDIYNSNRSAGEAWSAHINEYSGIATGKHVVRWITNHDENAWDATPQHNFLTEEGAFGAFVITSTIGGVPLIYNGQEVAEPQQLPFFEGNNTQINWLLNPAYKARYKALMAFRNQSEAIKTGALKNHSSFDVTAFSKVKGNQTVLVMVNVRNQAVDYPVPLPFQNTTWTNALTGEENVPLSNSVNLERFEALVLVK